MLTLLAFSVVILGAILLWGVSRAKKEWSTRILTNPTSATVAVARDETALQLISAATQAGPNQRTQERINAAIEAHEIIEAPSGTRAKSIDRKFFRGSKLYEPIAMSGAEMRASGTIEVEKVRILTGPYAGTEGWVPERFLRRTVPMP